MEFLQEGACHLVRDDFFPGSYSTDYRKDDFDSAEAAVVEALGLRYCSACPVRWECERHARTHPEPSGIWAGMTTKQRRAT